MTEAKKHPIQLKDIIVQELFFKLNKQENSSENDIQIKTQHASPFFDKEQNVVTVGIRALVGSEETNDPFFIRIEIIGVFEIDTNSFPIENIQEWGNKNAKFILQPYLREQLYSLSLRVGLKPIILPLVVVPTSRSTTQKTNE